MNYARIPRMLFHQPRTPHMMLRGPQVFYGPDDEDPEPDPDPDPEPAADPDPDPEPAADPDPDPDADPDPDPDADPEPVQARTPWQVKRLGKVTAKLSESEAENERLRKENAALKAIRGEGDPDPEPDPVPDPKKGRAYTEEEFNAEADRRASVKAINTKVDEVIADAEKLDKGFAARMPAIREAVGDQLGKRPDFFQALVKMPNSAAILNTLSNDLDRFSEMLELSAVDLALEIKDMDSNVKAPAGPGVSRAGGNPPPKVIDTSTTPELDLEKVSDEEYGRMRAKERQARAEERGGFV